LEAGVPIIEPPGAHAIYLDAASMLPQLERDALPGQALAVALYLEGGIRGVELGTVAFGYDDPDSGEAIYPKLELVRMALPRRVFTQSHLDYVVDVLTEIKSKAGDLRGMRMTHAPELLRHFSAHFKPL
jgi:tryptophanase